MASGINPADQPSSVADAITAGSRAATRFSETSAYNAFKAISRCAGVVGIRPLDQNELDGLTETLVVWMNSAPPWIARGAEKGAAPLGFLGLLATVVISRMEERTRPRSASPHPQETPIRPAPRTVEQTLVEQNQAHTAQANGRARSGFGQDPPLPFIPPGAEVAGIGDSFNAL